MDKMNIQNPLKGSPIFFLEETTSTMEAAKELVRDQREREGPFHGTVVWADYQSQGRGRFTHREWYGEKGKNLLFTVVLEERLLSSPVPPMSLVVGLSLAVAMEELFSLRPFIKWPNDLLCRNQKIAGVLTEKSGEVYYIGIGLNCNQTLFPDFDDNGFPPASLRTFLGKEIDRTVCLAAILRQLSLYLSVGDKKSSRGTLWKQELEKRLYCRGEEITISVGDPERDDVLRGRLVGIDNDGALLLIPNDGENRRVISGEISSSQSERPKVFQIEN